MPHCPLQPFALARDDAAQTEAHEGQEHEGHGEAAPEVVGALDGLEDAAHAVAELVVQGMQVGADRNCGIHAWSDRD